MPLTPEKVEEVRKLYEEGKSTREIAKALRLSLRDIGIALGPSIDDQLRELAELQSETDKKAEYAVKMMKKLWASFFLTAYRKGEEVICPYCYQPIVPADSADGKGVICPKCGKTLVQL
ncbi:hypothetical protein [Candidatus Methanodesulfokora washburnensis]|jgi:hypothetical protein|uniref:Uncharacterized protein n=1 Tax=Candidatus Methanodesulfokora washburnensis TaxID=2478471 RepID=A0A3R9R171_9CREN|nr:hypothetical protein [Candidatus Methanodesulfokores washburnensis]RSN72429.1 hypothetical protein D6D85_13835 [Candidatus Methanodesulfokores washburnensis]